MSFGSNRLIGIAIAIALHKDIIAFIVSQCDFRAAPRLNSKANGLDLKKWANV
jgi:hypothetical protein